MICACGCGRKFKPKNQRQKFFDSDCQYTTKLKNQKAPKTKPEAIIAGTVPTVLSAAEIEQRDIKRAIDERYAGYNDPGRVVTGEEFEKLCIQYGSVIKQSKCPENNRV